MFIILIYKLKDFITKSIVIAGIYKAKSIVRKNMIMQDLSLLFNKEIKIDWKGILIKRPFFLKKHFYLTYSKRIITGTVSFLITYSKRIIRGIVSFLITHGKRITLTVTIIVFFSTVTLSLIFLLQEYVQTQKRLKENLTIVEVIPGKTTLAELVKVKGYNFGWRLNKGDGLMSSYGPVDVKEWTNEVIKFVVPLHWKEGKVNLWIVKYKTDNPPTEAKISNVVSLQIDSRWSYYPEQEELDSKSIQAYVSRAIKKIRRFFLSRAEFLK